MSNLFNGTQPPVSTVIYRDGRRFDLVGIGRGIKSLWQGKCQQCGNGFLVETAPDQEPQSHLCGGGCCIDCKMPNGMPSEMMTVREWAAIAPVA